MEFLKLYNNCEYQLVIFNWIFYNLDSDLYVLIWLFFIKFFIIEGRKLRYEEFRLLFKFIELEVKKLLKVSLSNRIQSIRIFCLYFFIWY